MKSQRLRPTAGGGKAWREGIPMLGQSFVFMMMGRGTNCVVKWGLSQGRLSELILTDLAGKKSVKKNRQGWFEGVK